MAMPPFDTADFLVSANPATTALVIVVGLVFGATMELAQRGMVGKSWLYWQLAAGFVFFLPLAVLRGEQGSDTWSRLFGTGVLWGLFVLAKYIGANAKRRWRP
jgi:hypothetical protein